MAAVLKCHESMISMEEHERRMEAALMHRRRSNHGASCKSGTDRGHQPSKREEDGALEETRRETTTQENKGELTAEEHIVSLECQDLRERVASLEVRWAICALRSTLLEQRHNIVLAA